MVSGRSSARFTGVMRLRGLRSEGRELEVAYLKSSKA